MYLYSHKCRSYHIYKVVWSPYVGEMLLVMITDEHIVAVVRDAWICIFRDSY